MKPKFKTPSPALVISCMALLVALGPAVNAAATLADPNSVDTAAIQDHAVTTPKLASESVDSEKIAPGSVTGSKLASGSVDASKLVSSSVTAPTLAPNAVTSAKVLDESLTTADIKGADAKIKITLRAGAVANNRCKPFSLTVPGTKTGDVVLLSLQGALQAGVYIYGTQVATNGRATAVICNMSGKTLTAINKLPARVITFG